MGKKRSSRTTDKCPKSWKHRYLTHHVCSSYHKLGRSHAVKLLHSISIKQHTLLMPRAKSNPICAQKYRGKLKRILWIRIFISINQLWMAFLFLLGYVCWSLINSRLTLVCSLTNKHELWETLILPPALPRFSEVTSRKKMDGPWVFTCWIQLVSIQSYISHDNNYPFWFLQTNQLTFHSSLYAPLKNSSMRLGEVFCYLKANQIFSHSVTSQIANSAGHTSLPSYTGKNISRLSRHYCNMDIK